MSNDRDTLVKRLAAVTREVRCEPCAGTGEIESSDSTDESWWDCRRCKGKGVVVKPVTDLSGAELLADALLTQEQTAT
jgi:DnaJ-class molecular chaperone